MIQRKGTWSDFINIKRDALEAATFTRTFVDFFFVITKDIINLCIILNFRFAGRNNKNNARL